MTGQLSLEEKMLVVLVKKNSQADPEAVSVLACLSKDGVEIRKSRFETTYKTEAFQDGKLVYIKWQWVPKPDVYHPGKWEERIDAWYAEVNQNNA